MAKLYAILEAVADRVEMHKNIGEQRSNWNSLLLTSINALTLAAATMTGIAATSVIMWWCSCGGLKAFVHHHVSFSNWDAVDNEQDSTISACRGTKKCNKVVQAAS
ncbi:Uncharacterized protein Fot_39174 [Forsythia ovata]|uniref:Uncharacterized protein n=1 Tax=Forsythia ovata TaxID=205694 RepID=A0ABD1S3W0_9LAMI